jgi:hypothetical protein
VTRRKLEGLSTLLVDEVDVFFKDDFFGSVQGCDSYLELGSSHGKDLILYIWKNCLSRQPEDILQSSQVRSLYSKCLPDARDLINTVIRQMCGHARRVLEGKESPYEIRDDTILYEHVGELICCIHGFETLFCYVREFESGKILAKGLEAQCANLRFGIGEYSYAEVPLGFDLILGVTGTLGATSASERNNLTQMYGIEQYVNIPSVYGCNRLSFQPDNERGTVNECKG